MAQVSRRGKIEEKSYEKVAEGVIEGYQYVAFEVSKDELKKHLPEAYRRGSRIVQEILEEQGVAKDKVDKVVARIASGEIDPTTAIVEHEIEPDIYVPTAHELATEEVMRKILKTVKGAPKDAKVTEWGGNTEYSLYWDSESTKIWAGRWTWSEGGVPICFGLQISDEACNKVNDIIDKLKKKAEEEGRYLFFAIWESK